jgi:hypothetical protein
VGGELQGLDGRKRMVAGRQWFAQGLKRVSPAGGRAIERAAEQPTICV